MAMGLLGALIASVVVGLAPAPVVLGAGSAPPSSVDDVTVLALGDSWPAGAHCGGCRTFVGRYADGLEASGLEVTFVDMTQATIPGTSDGQTSQSLLTDLTSAPDVREAVGEADVIVIHTGINELAGDLGTQLFDGYGDPAACGLDGIDCVRRLGVEWRTNFDAMLSEIETLRSGQPTSIRLVTAENILTSDPGLVADFGAEFGPTVGRLVTSELAYAMCGVAQEHGAICVDVRRILNGPTLDGVSAGENAEESHQAVADALLATGLEELE